MRVARLVPFVLTAAAGCGFMDPLDQDGLYVLLRPADTALYVSENLQVRGLMVNAYGDQYPSEHFAYRGLDASVTVSSSGLVTGLSYGRARVIAARERFADTAWVSVVPPGTLAFSLQAEESRVDVTNVDGSGLRTIVTAGQSGGGAPSWLPGDEGLVYQYAVPGGAGATRIYLTNFAGETRQLAPSGRNPRVTRDGNWVYFGDAGILWRLHTDGSGLEQVGSGGALQPDPSPDGTRLVFIRLAATPPFGYQIAVRTLATGGEQPLGVYGQYPRWDPSGLQIAYWSIDPGGRGAIFVLDVDASGGTGARQVSLAGRRYSPGTVDWSPDGRWLLARSESTLDLIEVQTGLTLPLGYTTNYQMATWRPDPL